MSYNNLMCILLGIWSSAETLSKFGSGLFLFVQVILLLDFTYRWNDAWVEKDEQKWLVNTELFLKKETFWN